jgi:hypothetical protein
MAMHSSPCSVKCQRQALCPRCSLVEVIRFRFGAFRAKFGRDPRPDEPLFFDPMQELPTKASLNQAHGQIQAAAAAMGVTVGPVLRLLNLDSVHSKALRPAETNARPQRRPQRASWERLVRDKRLHRAHNITATELEMLSNVALMGEVRDSRDFLFILDRIRETRRH